MPGVELRRRECNPMVPTTVLQGLRCTAALPHSLHVGTDSLLQPCQGREVPMYKSNQAGRRMEAQSLTLFRNTQV